MVEFGVNFHDGKFCRRCDFDAVKQVASAITPVPGGTGPYDAMLMQNTLQGSTTANETHGHARTHQMASDIEIAQSSDIVPIAQIAMNMD